MTDSSQLSISRRSALGALAALGIGTAAFQRALAAQAERAEISAEMIKEAEWIAGITLAEEDRASVASAVARTQRKVTALREVTVDYGVAPAVTFFPMPPQQPGSERGEVRLIEEAAPKRPATDEDLAFLPVTDLAALVRTRQVTSMELTKLALARLKRFDPLLKCVVSLTEDVAHAQSEQADREIAAGRYRGPLHGIPWGAKDLIAYPGHKTTWGAGHYREQTLDQKATVARRLEEAGAVLVAKLTLGALALGDEWFGGMTRNPWNPEEGSSGSSAGSASAVTAGLVPFAIGSETLGSIVSPCRRCSVTGLRPTFGRVARTGCMTLAWTMDKLGPIARTVEDCALVLGAIHGYDGHDMAAVDRPFHWPAKREVASLKVGYFESDKPLDERHEIKLLRGLGVKLVPIKLPSRYPAGALTVMLTAETAASFDQITRAGVREGIGKWKDSFREGEFITAVDYLRASRIRTLLMQEMEELMSQVDLYVGGDDLALTNMTGHPTIVVPDGERTNGKNGQPGTITFTGRLYGETELLALAHAYQQASGAHLRRPPLEMLLAEQEKAKG